MHLITTAAGLLGDNMRQLNTKKMQISLDFYVQMTKTQPSPAVINANARLSF